MRRKKVGKLSVTVNRKTPNREQLLAKARELSERITKRTIEAGITTEQLEREAYKALQHVKRRRRFGSD